MTEAQAIHRMICAIAFYWPPETGLFGILKPGEVMKCLWLLHIYRDGESA